MMTPIPGLSFSSIKIHELPALTDGFSRAYQKEWIKSFSNHPKQFDPCNLENALQVLMKQPWQRGVQNESGPEFDKYQAKKAAGILGETHMWPLSEIFTDEQLRDIPIDNKVREVTFAISQSS